MSAGDVVLWHLAMSHYNEKARWALEYKRVPHRRRAVMPGLHQLVALKLGGRVTMPVLTIGDDVYPDSTEIVAALEKRWPEPPLYPADPDLRREALALEDELDEVLAPAVRQLAYQRLLGDHDAAATFLAFGGPPSRRTQVRLAMPLLALAIRENFGVPDREDSGPAETITRVVEDLGRRLGDRQFLVGDSFTVADLSACAYLAPLVCLDAIPSRPPLPPLFEDVTGRIAGMAAGAWAADTYRAYRLR